MLLRLQIKIPMSQTKMKTLKILLVRKMTKNKNNSMLKWKRELKSNLREDCALKGEGCGKSFCKYFSHGIKNKLCVTEKRIDEKSTSKNLFKGV